MRAVVITRHGGPNVLKVQERPDPALGAGEVIESRHPAFAAGDRLRHDRAHRQRRAAGQAEPGAGADEPDEHQPARGDPAATPGIEASFPLGAVDAQLPQQRLVFRVRWHRSHVHAKAGDHITAVVNCRVSRPIQRTPWRINRK